MTQNTHRQLFPYFQPIIGVATGQIVGYEALARQFDAKNQIVASGIDFFSHDGNMEELIQLDRSVRWQALQQFAQYQGGGFLALNMSTAWIEFVSDLSQLPTLQMIDQLNINRSRIVIEVVETQGDINKLLKVLKLYRNNGLKVAIDDFGAGFSQLERVMAIRPDMIKIDMRLFKQAAKGGVASEVVKMLTQLSNLTGCRVICEGIETDNEFLFALRCGAQYIQGHLFSPAQESFQGYSSYQKHIASLRQKFVNRTVAKQHNKIDKINRIKALIEQLKKKLEDDFDLNELVKLDFKKSGVMRFYLCDQDGNQTSPNFDFSENKWFVDSSKIGFNWSWRSYFYNLLALEEANQLEDNHFVTSERYKDFNSDQFCKTLATRLDAERILLVDIVE